MRGVDVEEAAAVGAELLDRDLRRDGPERNRLLGRGRLLGDRIALVVLERLAVGPFFGLSYVTGWTSVTVAALSKVCSTPWLTSTTANTIDSGSRM